MICEMTALGPTLTYNASMTEPELLGRVALISGASRGIGRACALRLAEAGAAVVVNYRQGAAEAEAVCAEIKARFQTPTLCIQADISVYEQVEQMFQQVLSQWQRLDILVNNAGIHRDGLLARMSHQDWDDVMRTNLNGLFYCSKLATKQMLKQKSGRLINITSVVGQTGNAGQTNYAASKAGVIGFTRSLARELAPRQIAVNAVAPGFIESEMTESLSEAQREENIKKIPYARFGSCSEVAEVVLFLASDRCQYMTGQTLNLDGGLVMN